MKNLKCCLVLIILLNFTKGKAQEMLNLYPGTIPNAKPTALTNQPANPSAGLVRRVITPTLEIYLPQKETATGAAVIICPGGSYSVLVYGGEGLTAAREFARQGVAAFVLRYRLPNDSFVTDKTVAPLQDAQQAIKTVRENAAKWGLDPGKIGIMGFSAGGHLAATAATHYQIPLIDNAKNTSLRPDFLILVYPVISMQDSLTHKDSRKNLLGKTPSRQTIDLYSNELQVNEQTPPTWLTHAGDDNTVDVDNSIAFYEQLRHHKVPAEMHIYPKGGHGFVLRQKPEEWMTPIMKWIEKRNPIGK